MVSRHEIPRRGWLPLLAISFLLAQAAAVCGQERTAVAPAAVTSEPGLRRLAPGVLTVIPPDTAADLTEIRGDIPEITRGLPDRAWKEPPLQATAHTTLVERAKNREFYRDVWCLEFAFKPPRLIEVDVPAADLTMQRKQLWYLLYRVKNTGGRRTVVDADDSTQRRTETFERAVRFLPHFVLESLEPLEEAEGLTAYRAYLDRVVPSAMEPIRRREDPAIELHDSASMAARDIAPGDERWGVAVWEDVDPRIDVFSIIIRGLTNAVRWRERENAVFGPDTAPGSGMDRALECLRLDFFRPGDDRRGPDEQMSVGYAGMFERMTLGARLVEAVGRPRALASRPLAGLDQLGLGWKDLLDPQPGAAKAKGSPLRSVVSKLVDMKDPALREPAVVNLFGELGARRFDELWAAVVARGDEDVTRAEAMFSAPRLAPLAKDLGLARTLATLEALGIDQGAIAAGDSLAAFDRVRSAIDAEEDADTRRRLLEGLFGPRGPDLYAAATANREGIDHSWVFRYETE
ncbi:MAG: hypothetical protein EBZ59_01750 [Planctomycetia bacterium]|nr:hypothetical protein [Planctomycetia bacterium]